MSDRYYIFFTLGDGTEELGGSHYDFDRMCDLIELFLEINREREFAFVSACLDSDGIREVVRWQRGSTVPVLDLR